MRTNATDGERHSADNKILYWGVTGVFVAIFGASALWNIADPEGARLDYLALGYPGYVVYPVSIAKLVGLAVILRGRNRTLVGLAFAGFLYDVILALGAQVATGQGLRALLAAFTLVVTVAAWWLDHARFTAAPRNSSVPVAVRAGG